MQVLRAVYLVGTIFMVTVHSVLSNTLRDAKNMNLLAPNSRSIVCFANSIYANRINSRGMSRVFCDLRSQKTPRGILPVNSNYLWFNNFLQKDYSASAAVSSVVSAAASSVCASSALSSAASASVSSAAASSDAPRESIAAFV